jgi:RecB family endonuclease NucS
MNKIMLFDKDEKKILYCTKYEKEYELQELVKDSPTIIEIKSIFDSPLLIIGRETLQREARRIDVLGITLSGVPVIIECKRKENQDMRSLIAQIFEYGSILKTKTFVVNQNFA